MKRIVLDAGVAAKWLLPPPREPLRREAMALLERYNWGQFEIFVPDLFWIEVANFLWKDVRLGRCSAAEAQTALQKNSDYNFHTARSIFLLEKALDVAIAADRAIHNCIYVALGAELKAEFVTAEERLANALASRFQVTILAAF